MLSDNDSFIKGRIHVIKLRLEKARRRVERSIDAGKPCGAEQERTYRLTRILALHESDPKAALLLYNNRGASC